ncbi:MAG: acetylxylan esterase, partial [Armatimonadetes bacterium]|nr:acetylxylan esterase [Armatimonadota bacterium]
MNLPLAAALVAMTTVNLHGETIEIPDPLTLSSGQKVASVEGWQTKRRPELLELFRANVYGRAPIERPRNLKFEVSGVQKDAMNGAATRKHIKLSFSGPGGQGAINVLLFVP